MATIGRTDEPRRFIESLAKQGYRDFELIIVDQNSDSRVLPIYREAIALGITVSYLRQNEPNLCVARNAGLKVATKQFVAFPDDDCWYEPDALAIVAGQFVQSDVPHGWVIRWHEWSETLAGSFPTRFLSLERWKRFAEPGCPSYTLFLDGNLIKSVGAFDSAFGLHSWFGAGEEVDLMFRVLMTGAKIAYLRNAVVHHRYSLTSASTLSMSFSRALSRERATGALYAKYELPLWVIAKGLFSPLIRIVVSPPNVMFMARQLGTLLGRWEGYIMWSIKECRHIARGTNQR